MALSILLSGAPIRVHLVDLISLLIAFTIPAALITAKKDIQDKWKIIIIFWLSGTLAWFFLTALVVVKAGINLERFALLLPASFIGLMIFLGLHMIILNAITRHEST